MATLIKTNEVYRVNTEDEATEFINAEKEKAKEMGYELKSYKSLLKEKKAKGEVIDCGVEVTLLKVHNSFWEV